MLGWSPQCHSCCYSQHLPLADWKSIRSPVWWHHRSHIDFQVRHDCHWYVWVVHGKWLKLMLFWNCAPATWLQIVCLCTCLLVLGEVTYYLFEIGMIKGCHPCLSSWPPCLWTVEEIASLQGSVPSEWAEGENVSSKNQKRPHGFKYFQVARN